jgi:Domain of unknown function (DUF4062)
MPDVRPRVFISSTIADFADLRSALKFWLNEAGYDAQLSEYSDFVKSVDLNAVDACLSTLESADYYLLLIGSRVGSLYDAAKRISVTRAEYQRAYESFKKTGKPHIIAFVRDSVMSIRDDRKALAASLADGEGKIKELSDDERSELANHSSRFVTDAEAIFEFIAEATRQAEADAAASQNEPLPVANWVHMFHGFDDIVSVLRGEIKIRRINRAAIESNLRSELQSNVRALLEKQSDGSLRAAASYITKLRERVQLTMEYDDTVLASPDELLRAAHFHVYLRASSTLTSHAVDEAIRSGEFLRWDPRVHTFVPTNAHRALLLLRQEIARAAQNVSIPMAGLLEATVKWASDWRKRQRSDADNKPTELVRMAFFIPLFAVHDRQENILSLYAALLALIDDGEEAALDSVRVWPPTPIDAKRAGLAAGVGKGVRTAMWLSDRAKVIVEEAAEIAKKKSDS